MTPTYKAWVMIIISIGLLVGLLTGRFDDPAWGLLGYIVATLVTNGAAARRGEVSLPPILPKRRDDGPQDT